MSLRYKFIELSIVTEQTIEDVVNDWVGQSQWSKDHPYQGTFNEVRIYNVALNACQLHTLLERGPDSP